MLLYPVQIIPHRMWGQGTKGGKLEQFQLSLRKHSMGLRTWLTWPANSLQVRRKPVPFVADQITQA
jgi:hypothetical protein